MRNSDLQRTPCRSALTDSVATATRTATDIPRTATTNRSPAQPSDTGARPLRASFKMSPIVTMPSNDTNSPAPPTRRRAKNPRRSTTRPAPRPTAYTGRVSPNRALLVQRTTPRGHTSESTLSGALNRLGDVLDHATVEWVIERLDLEPPEEGGSLGDEVLLRYMIRLVRRGVRVMTPMRFRHGAESRECDGVLHDPSSDTHAAIRSAVAASGCRHAKRTETEGEGPSAAIMFLSERESARALVDRRGAAPRPRPTSCVGSDSVPPSSRSSPGAALERSGQGPTPIVARSPASPLSARTASTADAPATILVRRAARSSIHTSYESRSAPKVDVTRLQCHCPRLGAAGPRQPEGRHAATGLRLARCGRSRRRDAVVAVERLDLQPLHFLHLLHHQLGDAVAAVHMERLVRVGVEQHHLDLAAVGRVDEAGRALATVSAVLAARCRCG